MWQAVIFARKLIPLPAAAAPPNNAAFNNWYRWTDKTMQMNVDWNDPSMWGTCNSTQFAELASELYGPNSIPPA